MRRYLLFFLIPILLSGQNFNPQKVVFSGEQIILQRQAGDSLSHIINYNDNKSEWMAGEKEYILKFTHDGENSYKIDDDIYNTLSIPGWLSLLPPFIAILLALIFRQVIIALIAGIWIGAFVLADFNLFYGSLRVIDYYIINSLANPDHVSIIVFSLLLGGMVGIISRSGGAEGIVYSLAKFASNRRRGQFITGLMGVLIFFDDYANTLIVGNTMRPLNDKLKISREKLAYIVDSTAAPVVSLMFISTWIGYEVSLIQDAFNAIGYGGNGYLAWMQSIPYRFYSILALAMVFIVALLNRDFGPMLKAEKRVAEEGKLLRDGANPLTESNPVNLSGDAPKRWYNAIIPIISVIVTVFAALYWTGFTTATEQNLLSDGLNWTQQLAIVIGHSDSFTALLWASSFGVLVAAFLTLGQKILNLNEVIDAWMGGMKSMLIAVIILTLAWSIGNICTEIHTAKYVVSISESLISVKVLPALVFIISAVVAFSTGTSWGTMAIMFPIVLPMANELSGQMIDSAFAHILYATIASVLSGSVFGDHCSPISDTTIMSSMASGSDHVDHVRTQLPYALLVGVVAILIGYLPVGWDFSPWIGNILGLIILIILVRLLGKKVKESADNSEVELRA